MSWAEKEAIEWRMQTKVLLEAHPDLDDRTLYDSIDGVTEFVEAMDWLVRAEALNVEAIVGLKDRLTQNKDRLSRFERGNEALRDRMKNAMELAGETALKLPEATLSIRAGKARVIVTDESLLPPHLMTQPKLVPDKLKIVAALANHPTAVSGAEMSNAEPILTIRRK